METLSPSMIDTDVLMAVFAPDRPDMDPASARSLLKLGFTDAQKAQMHELAEKNN